MRYSDYDLYKDLLREKAGLYISADKSWLLDARLSPVAAKWNYPSLSSMTLSLRGIADPGLIKDVVEAMIDTQTTFFRYPAIYEFMRDTALPSLRQRRKSARALRIWHAGCGTGQEPYSMAMTIRDNTDKVGNMPIEIVATDISMECLNKAIKGIYTNHDVQHGLSAHTLLKYFNQKDGDWHLRPDITGMVKFQYGNLLDSLAPLGQFDVIVCADVLPHIALDMQPKVLAAMQKQLTPDGYLLTEDAIPLAS